MAFDENLSSEQEQDRSDFSGNYMENFQKAETKDHFPGACEDWEKVGNKFYFHGENATLELTVLSQDIFKFRYGNDGYFEDDFSYALDPDFQPEYVKAEFKERSNYFSVNTDNIKCYIYKSNLKTTIYDMDGNVLMEDEKGYHWQEEKNYGGNVVLTTKKLRKDENFFALGDKTAPLNMKGYRRELWGTDCYGYGWDSDPVYKNIPFYITQHPSYAYGVFMDNTFRSFFDFGYERKTVTSFWAQGGEMRFYFIYGPKVEEVCRRYTLLTGKPEMPPKWALGYHQSKWSYYPEQTVRDLAKEFRDRQIPCDVIHLDIDYMDGFRCFTWDKERFPRPNKMMSELGEDGFKFIVIIDPGIKIDKKYWVYQQGIENNYFCVRGDGPLLKGSVWPGPCHFPDFTNREVRQWWSSLFEGLVNDGVAAVWNDMNEPAMFEEGTFPLDTRHDFDGHPCTHRKAHNVYGSLMAQSTYSGLQKFLDNKRPFTITRSAYAGVQRFASVWTGDNSASWEHLKLANIQCQRLSASGISFAGSDVGGFIGTPSGELFIRWIQMAVFHPFFRTHSSGDHGDKEPWVFGEEYTDIARKFIEMRYELLPYVYTTFWQYAKYGQPMIRSLFMVDQEDPETYYRQDEFLFGDYIHVTPVSTEGARTRKVYLPQGHWYNYWTDEKHEGKQEIEVEAPLDQIPIFIKAGAIIPRQPKMQYTDAFAFDDLRLDIYLDDGLSETTIYEDEGEGLEYKRGTYNLRKISALKTETFYLIKQETKEENYNSPYKNFKMVFHGSPKPHMVMVDGENMTDRLEDHDQQFALVVPKTFKELLLT